MVCMPPLIPNEPPVPAQLILAAMPQRRFPAHGDLSQSPAGIGSSMPMVCAGSCVRTAADAIAMSDKRLTNNEAERIARLIARLPELVELRRSGQGQEPPQAATPPLQARDGWRPHQRGKLREVDCGNCRPARHLSIDAGSLDLPKRLPVPEVANHLVCSVCGAKNSDTYHPIWARPDARVPGVTGRYPGLL